MSTEEYRLEHSTCAIEVTKTYQVQLRHGLEDGVGEHGLAADNVDLEQKHEVQDWRDQVGAVEGGHRQDQDMDQDMQEQVGQP